MPQDFDVVVIGAGPGGSTVARLLATGGKKAALVEKAALGGTCLNCGCIPTKFLLAATAPAAAIQGHARLGTVSGEAHVNFAALQQRKNRFVKGSSQALGKTLAAAGVKVFSGFGTIVGKGSVSVAGDAPAMLTCEHIVIATGSRSAAYPGLTPDGNAVLNSTMLLDLETVPQSLLVVGAGAIGLEFADFYGSLGASVTIVEAMPQLAPTEDTDIADELRKILQKSGKVCITGEKVASLVTHEGQALLTFADGRTLTAAKALVAVGRFPNSADLGLESIGATCSSRGFITVDANLQAVPGCFVVGDVNGLALLAHAADHQAAYVAGQILGTHSGTYISGPIPSCVYGNIEIMRVGKTAQEIRASGGKVFVSKVPMTLNPIAQAHAATAGFAKAVWDGDTLVGMAALGHGVSHLVTAAQLLIYGGFTAENMHQIMIAHPTLDEILASAITAPKVVFA